MGTSILYTKELLTTLKTDKITLSNCNEYGFKIGDYVLTFPDPKLFIKLMRLMKETRKMSALYYVDTYTKRLSMRFENAVYELNLSSIDYN